MTTLLAPKPMVFYRKVKAVKVAARIPALRHPPFSLSFHVRSVLRTTTSWSRR
jgi:hypothetical protein